MHMLSRIFLLCLCTIFCFVIFSSLAEAKRFGKGRSIGSSSSTSRSFTSMRPRNTPQTPLQQRQQSQFGSFGRIATALLAGSIIGSLLSGSHIATGVGILDIILIGAVIFIIYRLLTMQKDRPCANLNYSEQINTTDAIWTHLEDDTEQEPQSPLPLEASGIDNFDINSFLKGAKILFTRMQKAWSLRDLEDIKHFTTKHVFEEIAMQAQEDPTPATITILHMQAEVTGTQTLGNEEYADVLFLATLQEDDENIKISEIWRFVRSKEENSTWKLGGITQISL